MHARRTITIALALLAMQIVPAAARPAQHAPSVDEAEQLVIEAMTAAAAKPPRCRAVIGLMAKALPIVAPEVTTGTLKTYEAYADCLLAEKWWFHLLPIARGIEALDPDHFAPVVVPQILAGLGRWDDAAAEIVERSRARPRDPDLADARADVACAREQWRACADAAAVALALERSRDERAEDPPALAVHLLRARALVHLGALDDADRELAIVERVQPEDAAARALRQIATFARGSALVVEPIVQSEIGLGVYHLYATQRELLGAPARVELVNVDAVDHAFRIEARIAGITEPAVSTIAIAKGGTADVALVPALRPSYDIDKLTASQLVEMSVTVARDGKVVFEQTYPLTLFPRQDVPKRHKISADRYATHWELVAAWVTPTTKEIEELVTAAKRRLPRMGFSGTQTKTLPQVKAFFDELKSRGVSYVMDPTIFSGVGQVQRVRLPREVLASTNAQCVESSVLFATLLESLGIHVTLFSVPGHMFIGWRTSKLDVGGERMVYLETTAVHGKTFEQAMASATKRHAKEVAAGNFKNGAAIAYDLEKLRRRGISAQPVD
jgi:hypothetical protein